MPSANAPVPTSEQRLLALEAVCDWLRCPVCAEPLALEDRSLRCPNRHSFDVAKQGHVNLLGAPPPRNADTAAMVAARDRFLSAGWYSPITDAVATALAGHEAIVEVGAGTGHYLAHALGPTAKGLATDVSVAAARRAARAHERVASVVADTWAGLPVRDHVVDAVLCVFAPRNLNEFRRVLRPDGVVVVVVPNPGHLAQLRERHGLLGIDDHKADALAEQFDDATITRVQCTLELDGASATNLVAMGPNAFHDAPELPASSVTCDVSVVVGTPRR